MIRPSKRVFLPLLLPLLPASLAVAAQSTELVQAKARLKALNIGLEKLNHTIAREPETALPGQLDTSTKDKFETSGGTKGTWLHNQVRSVVALVIIWI